MYICTYIGIRYAREIMAVSMAVYTILCTIPIPNGNLHMNGLCQ